MPRTMTFYYKNGKTRTLKGIRTLTRYLWQVQSVIVVGTLATFNLGGGGKIVGDWADQDTLWQWLHSRRTLRGTPLVWDTRILHVDPSNKEI